MPPTTTAFTACDAVLKLDNESGTPVDISGSTNNVSWSFDAKIGEFKPFGAEWMSRVQCGKDASISLKGIATTSVQEIKDLIEDWFFNSSHIPRTFSTALPAGTTGNAQYSAEVFLVSYSFDLDSGTADPVMFTIEFKPTGEVLYDPSIA